MALLAATAARFTSPRVPVACSTDSSARFGSIGDGDRDQSPQICAPDWLHVHSCSFVPWALELIAATAATDPRVPRLLPESGLAALDAVRPNFLVQVGYFDAEHDCGSRDVPLESPQRLDDVAAFGVLSVFTEREPLAARAGHRRNSLDLAGTILGRGFGGVLAGRLVVERVRVGIFGQVGDRDHVRGQDGGALDDVLQL